MTQPDVPPCPDSLTLQTRSRPHTASHCCLSTQISTPCCTCVYGAACVCAHTPTCTPSPQARRPHTGTRSDPVNPHTHRDTHIQTPALQHPHAHSPAAQLGTRMHTHTFMPPSTRQAGPEPASPAKRETPAPGEATLRGTGWQPLSQPRGARRDPVRSRGKVGAS